MSSDNLEDSFQRQAKIEELSDSDNEGLPFPGRHLRHNMPIPPWLDPSTLSLFPESIDSQSAEAFTRTRAECLPHLLNQDTQGLPLNKYGLPHLRREEHIAFLHASLNPLPAPYVALDAARPWLFYWAFQGLTALGQDISSYRPRFIETVRPLQNKTGGYGGGHGQFSHCAASYATILSLAMVDALNEVNRTTMHHWLGQLKQPNGGFTMAEGAEEDLRGAFCAFIIITILNLPLTLPASCPARTAGLTRFDDNLASYIGSLQTYEGGIGAAPPATEAHGAYAFLAMGTLSLLDAPHISIPESIDLPLLLHWLAQQQTSPEGGFAGRTNKLVDACYSQWIGGTWALVEAAVRPARTKGSECPDDGRTSTSVWNRAGLVRYLLTCAQQPGKKGGMRDKPSTRPDGYHTTYSLAGLSAAMNRYSYDARAGTAERDSRASEAASGQRGDRSTAAFQWRAERCSKAEMAELGLEREEDGVEFVHPVFVVPFSVVEAFRAQFAGKGLED